MTSYVELALAPHGADRAHPAFSKMFVETEALAGRASPPGQAQAPLAEGPGDLGGARPGPTPGEQEQPEPEYETDRARFIGRGRGPGEPRRPRDQAFRQRRVGPRSRLQPALPADGARRAAGCGWPSSPGRPRPETERSPWPRSTGTCGPPTGLSRWRNRRHPGGQASQGERRGASALPAAGQPHALSPTPRFRAPASVLRSNRLGQSGLWAHGISGDLPILLVTVGDRRDMQVVREALLAHAYWRLRGFKADLVILNEEAGGYEQPLQGRPAAAHPVPRPVHRLDQPGGIFLRAAEQMPVEDLTLLLAVARVVLVAARGALVQQLGTAPEASLLPPGLRQPAAGGESHRRRCRSWSCRTSTAWAASRPTVGSTRSTWARARDASALGQRDGQPWLRRPGLGVGHGLRLGRELPEQPAAPVVQRPGDRPGRATPSTSATSTSGCSGRRPPRPSGSWTPTGPATARATPSSSTTATPSSRSW